MERDDVILNQLDQLVARHDKISDTLIEVQKLQAVQNSQLAEHMRRTAQLEDAFKPIQKHVDHVDGGIKLIGLVSLVAGVIAAVMKLIGQ